MTPETRARLHEAAYAIGASVPDTLPGVRGYVVAKAKAVLEGLADVTARPLCKGDRVRDAKLGWPWTVIQDGVDVDGRVRVRMFDGEERAFLPENLTLDTSPAPLPLPVLEAGGGQTDPPVHGPKCAGPRWRQERSRYECNCGNAWVAVPLVPEEAAPATGEHRWLDAADSDEVMQHDENEAHL